MAKPKKPTGSERFNFLLPFIGYIMKNDYVTIAEAAEHFDVSEEYVREAISTLTVTATQRSHGGEDLYYNFDPQLLDEDGTISLVERNGIDAAPKLSAKQVAALSAGLSILSTLPEFTDQDEIAELLDLISRGSTTNAPAIIHYQPGTVDADAAVIRKAMLQGHRISCEYVNIRGEQTTREIDPIRLDPHGGVWYLRGYCHVHKELRNFRLDHMRAAKELEVAICQQALEIREIDDAEYIAAETDIEVTVEVQPEAYSMLVDFAAENQVRNAKTGTVQATIKIGYLPYLGKVIARYGGAARVIAPESARRVVREYAQMALEEPIDQLPEVE